MTPTAFSCRPQRERRSRRENLRHFVVREVSVRQDCSYFLLSWRTPRDCRLTGHCPLTTRGRPQTWRSLFFAPWTFTRELCATERLQGTDRQLVIHVGQAFVCLILGREQGVLHRPGDLQRRVIPEDSPFISRRIDVRALIEKTRNVA